MAADQDSWVQSALGVDVGSMVSTVESAASSAADTVTSVASTAVNDVGSAASSAVDTASSAADTVTSVATAAVNGVGSAARSAVDTASAAADTVTSVASTAVNDVGSAASSAVDTVSAVASSAADTFTSAATTVVDDVKAAASSAVDTVTSAAATVVSDASGKLAAAGGGPGFPVNVSIPIDGPELPAWNGKIKVKYKGKIGFDATVGGPKGAAVTTFDMAKGFGEKASKTWWQGSGKITLAGIDIFKNPKVTTDGAINKEGVTAKLNYSIDTLLGTATVSATLFEYKPPKPPTYGALGGSLKGTVKIGDQMVDGVSIHDISISSEMGFEVAPQYVKIIADTLIDGLKKAGQNAAEAVTGEAVLGFAIEAGVLLVAVGVIAGSFNELSKASDERQLVQAVGDAIDSYTAGVHQALHGGASPGGGFGDAGWKAGKKVFDDAAKQAKSLHSDWDDDQIRIQVGAAADGLENSSAVQKLIRRNVGQLFWDHWVAANHGRTTFLGDAKTACGICFGRAVLDDNDPDLAAWEKVSELPDFFAGR